MGKFKFKKFEVAHDRSALKIGTDAVLLGAWAPIEKAMRILDIGTGCGVIALMAAQRNEIVLIDAIDIDAPSIGEANANFNQSLWHQRLQSLHTRLQDFQPDYKYDHIISNPPYFEAGTASPNIERQRARHTSHLSFDTLFLHASALLAHDGKCSIIIPYMILNNVLECGTKYNLYPERMLLYKARVNHPTERVLITFSRDKIMVAQEVMVHYDGNEWSDDYKSLTKDFYLKL